MNDEKRNVSVEDQEKVQGAVNDLLAGIFGSRDFEIEVLKIDEWGGLDYGVRTMTGDRRGWVERHIFEITGVGKDNRPIIKQKESSVRSVTAVATLCHPVTGEFLFKCNDDNVARMGERSTLVLDRILNASNRINKMRPEDIQAEMGNSPATDSGDSPSD